eukprot:TRINITY_DN5358_c0_g1_i2.p1 TRINITY_DN5358_c0_g1~~TRINITY_DN5358_c0_g1_i2.p1  ORF type:complete len:241 (+),score=42.02 TRINITY_DN5358_c0_g1_i2:152-874(+)
METLRLITSPRSDLSSSCDSYTNQVDELRHQLKRAEEANYRLAATLELVPVATCVLDSKARLLFINAVGVRILGLPHCGNAQQLIGKAFPPCYTHWSRDLLIKTALPRAARSGHWAGELAILDASTGKEVLVNQQIQSQRRPDNSLFFSITFHRSTDFNLPSQRQEQNNSQQPLTPQQHSNKQSPNLADTNLKSDPQSEEDEGPSTSKDKAMRIKKKSARCTKPHTNFNYSQHYIYTGEI